MYEAIHREMRSDNRTLQLLSVKETYHTELALARLLHIACKQEVVVT